MQINDLWELVSNSGVPGNRQCGVCPTELPEEMKAYCERMTESPQG